MENIINKKHNIMSDVNFELHALSKEVLRRQHSKDSVTVNNDKGSHSSFCRTRRAALEVQLWKGPLLVFNPAYLWE